MTRKKVDVKKIEERFLRMMAEKRAASTKRLKAIRKQAEDRLRQIRERNNELDIHFRAPALIIYRDEECTQRWTVVLATDRSDLRIQTRNKPLFYNTRGQLIVTIWWRLSTAYMKFEDFIPGNRLFRFLVIHPCNLYADKTLKTKKISLKSGKKFDGTYVDSAEAVEVWEDGKPVGYIRKNHLRKL